MTMPSVSLDHSYTARVCQWYCRTCNLRNHQLRENCRACNGNRVNDITIPDLDDRSRQVQMDEDLLARIETMRLSRRAGAQASPHDSDAAWLSDWVVHNHFPELDSTQSYVEREQASLDPKKLTVISADFQTAGRGTRDRQWHSGEAQSALMTFYFRFPEECSKEFINRNVPNVTQVLAVSAVDVLRRTARNQDGLCFNVKWPNDIIVNDRKIAGILARAEASPGSRLDRITVGIGVNLNAPQADLDLIERPVFPATSLRAISGCETVFDVGAFRQELAVSFAAALRRFFIEGFAGFLEQLNALDVYLNRRICFQVNQNNTFDATYLGINESGHVSLRLDDGKVQAFPSGEVLQRAPGEAPPPREPDKPVEEVRKKGEPRGRESEVSEKKGRE